VRLATIRRTSTRSLATTTRLASFTRICPPGARKPTTPRIVHIRPRTTSGCAVSNNQENINTFPGHYYPSSFLYANMPTRCSEANNTAYSTYPTPNDVRLATIRRTSTRSLATTTRLASFTRIYPPGAWKPTTPRIVHFRPPFV
jgi:hypothetical protein